MGLKIDTFEDRLRDKLTGRIDQLDTFDEKLEHLNSYYSTCKTKEEETVLKIIDNLKRGY